MISFNDNKNFECETFKLENSGKSIDSEQDISLE